jgi:hypothetical protein
VFECRFDELVNMIVRERVVDVLAVAPVLDDALGLEDAQLLRERGHLLPTLGRELGDAALAAATELLDQAKAVDVTGGAEQGGRTRARFVADSVERLAVVAVRRHQVLISTNDEAKGFLRRKYLGMHRDLAGHN